MADFILSRTIKAGKPIATRTKVLLELSLFLDKLDPNRPWQVLVRQWKKSRTDDQNAALFGLAYKIICDETGCDKDELHEEMCKRFFGTIEVEVLGQIKTRPLRTTTRDAAGKRDILPWDEFSNFYTKVESEAAAFGIRIPPPDPLWKHRAARNAAA